MNASFKTMIMTIFLLSFTLLAQASLTSTATQTLGSGRSQIALSLYSSLKVVKKAALIQKFDTYYDKLRTLEQGALHYGISTALIELTMGSADQLSSTEAFVEGIIFIAISGLTRLVQAFGAKSSLGRAIQRKIEGSGILPTGSEQLCQEALICILSALAYIQFKKLVPLLLQP